MRELLFKLSLTSLELSFIVLQVSRWDFRGKNADANRRRQKANSYSVFEVTALSGPKYNIEADKLFWFVHNDAKEAYELAHPLKIARRME